MQVKELQDRDGQDSSFLMQSGSAWAARQMSCFFLYEVPKLFSEIELLLRAISWTFVRQTVRIMMRSWIEVPTALTQISHNSRRACDVSTKKGDLDDVCKTNHASVAQVNGPRTDFRMFLRLFIITPTYELTLSNPDHGRSLMPKAFASCQQVGESAIN
jgi:hypothetical protein